MASLHDLSPTSTVKYALKELEWHLAKQVEFEGFLKNHTSGLVPHNPSQNIVDNKWIFRVKRMVDGTTDRFKVHLVAKGFMQCL